MDNEYQLGSFVPRRPDSARPVIIIQARMNSTRLPGKVLLPLCGVPMVQGMLRRLSVLKERVPIILAISTHPNDTILMDVAATTGVAVIRGSEEDVLDRYVKAVASTSADTVVRLTADCPLSDPEMVDQALDLFYHLHVEYLSNSLRRTYPRGFDIEIMSRTALESAAREAVLHREREHVTPFIRNHPERFSQACFVSPEDFSSWRLTVDTKEDAEIVQHVLSKLGGSFTFETVKHVLEAHEEWRQINAHVQQKQD